MKRTFLPVLCCAALGGGLGVATSQYQQGAPPVALRGGGGAPTTPQGLPPNLANTRPKLATVLAAPPGQRAELLSNYLAAATAEDLTELGGYLLSQPGRVSDPQIVEEIALLMERWAEVDAPAALAAAIAADGTSQLSRYFFKGTRSPVASLLQAWGRLDAKAALQASQQWGAEGAAWVLMGLKDTDPAEAFRLADTTLPAGHAKNSAMAEILDTLALQDPAQAAALLEQSPTANSPNGDARHYKLVMSWMQRDPEAALQWARQQLQANKNKECWYAVLSHFQDADPARARQLLKEAPGRCKEVFQKQFAIDLATSDPQAAQAFAAQLPAGLARKEMMLFIAASASGNNPELAWSIMESLKAGGDPQGSARKSVIGGGGSSYMIEGESPSGALSEIFRSLAGSNPAEALRLSRGWNSRNGRSEGSPMQAVLDAWLKTNPESAWAAMKALPPKDFLAPNALGTWLAGQPADQIATRLQDIPEAQQQRCLQSLIENGGGKPVHELIDLVVKFPSENSSGPLWQLASHAPLAKVEDWKESAAKLPAALQQQFLGNVTSQAPAPTVPGALENLRSLADLPQAATTLANYTSQHLEKSPEIVSQWVSGLPPGPVRDASASNIATWLRTNEKDPEGAFHWAASIQDAAKQKQSVDDAYAAWYQENPDEAAAALQGSAVPETLKNSLLGQ